MRDPQRRAVHPALYDWEDFQGEITSRLGSYRDMGKETQDSGCNTDRGAEAEGNQAGVQTGKNPDGSLSCVQRSGHRALSRLQAPWALLRLDH